MKAGRGPSSRPGLPSYFLKIPIFADKWGKDYDYASHLLRELKLAAQPSWFGPEDAPTRGEQENALTRWLSPIHNEKVRELLVETTILSRHPFSASPTARWLSSLQ